MTSPQPPPSNPTVRPVAYKGEPLDSRRGPGFGCFRFQVALLAVLVILTPLTVAWNWPVEVSIALLFATLLLLLFAGQTVIFLLRLVAADRRDGRRVPMASPTPTVGELEDVEVPDPASDGDPVATSDATIDGTADSPAGGPRLTGPGVRE